MSIYSRESIEDCISNLVDKYKVKQNDKFIFEKENSLYFCKMLSSKPKINATKENLEESEAIEVLSVQDLSLNKFKSIFDKVAKKNKELLGDSTTFLRSLPVMGSEEINVYPVNDQQFQIANEAVRSIKEKQEKKSKVIVNIKNI